MVLLCDGRLVCGCADPYGKRVLGDARSSTVSAVWMGETAATLRQDLNGGGSKFCGDCPLKLPLKGAPAPQRDLNVSPLPSTTGRGRPRSSSFTFSRYRPGGTSAGISSRI